MPGDKRELDDDGFENQQDEQDILSNQDETDSGEVGADDARMGAGPTDELTPMGETGDFARGEVDVKEQMDRASRVADYPNRAVTPKPDHLNR